MEEVYVVSKRSSFKEVKPRNANIIFGTAALFV
jgi:hypothetical protein